MAKKPAKPATKERKPRTVAMSADKPAVTRKRAPNYSDEEKRAALETVIASGGNVAKAARTTGIPEDTLRAWHLGDGVSDEIHKDYKANARARVRERVSAMHASTDEVLSLAAIRARGDFADLAPFLPGLKAAGIDWEAAQAAGVSRTVKKLKITKRDCKNADGDIEPETTLEIELHDPFRDTQLLADIHGLRQQKASNENDAEARRAFWRERIDKAMSVLGLGEAEAKAWLLENVESAKAESQWLM